MAKVPRFTGIEVVKRSLGHVLRNLSRENMNPQLYTDWIPWQPQLLVQAGETYENIRVHRANYRLVEDMVEYEMIMDFLYTAIPAGTLLHYQVTLPPPLVDWVPDSNGLYFPLSTVVLRNPEGWGNSPFVVYTYSTRGLMDRPSPVIRFRRYDNAAMAPHAVNTCYIHTKGSYRRRM